jgi:hypothetical protein
MIFWNEYKEYKKIALKCIDEGDSLDGGIKIELLKFQLNHQTKEQTIENIINYLSDGKHYDSN